MRVSLVIPHRNRCSDLFRCLESVEKMSPAPDEVIIVDDASSTCCDVKNRFHLNIKMVQLNRHLGTAIAKNEGAKIARGDYLWFLDSDSEVIMPSMLEYGLGEFGKMERLGVLGGEGVWDESSREWKLKIKTLYSNCDTREELVSFGGEHDFDVAVVSTCNFLIPKIIFDLLGGFEGILEIGEDKEFCLRMRKLNFLLKDSSAFLISHHASSAEKELRLYRFFFKNHVNQLKTAVMALPFTTLLLLPYVDIISKYIRFCDQSKAVIKISSAAHGPQARLMAKYRRTSGGRMCLYFIFLLSLPVSYVYIIAQLPLLLSKRIQRKRIFKKAKFNRSNL